MPGIDLQLVSFPSLSVRTVVTSRQLLPLLVMGPESHTLRLVGKFVWRALQEQDQPFVWWELYGGGPHLLEALLLVAVLEMSLSGMRQLLVDQDGHNFYEE